MQAAHSISRLSTTEAAAIEALLDPAARLGQVAARLALGMAEFLDLLNSAPVRAALQTLTEIEAIRTRLLGAPFISSSLATLQKLLGKPDANPIESRRTATAILRACQSPSRERRVSSLATRERPVVADTLGARAAEGFRDSSTSRERQRPAAPNGSLTQDLGHRTQDPSALSTQHSAFHSVRSPQSSVLSLLAAAGQCGPAP